MEIISILLNPKLMAIIGPVGALLLAFCGFLYKLYKRERGRSESAEKKNDELQEKRLSETQQMAKDYYELAADMEKTLDAVLKAIKSRGNGNGNGAK